MKTGIPKDLNEWALPTLHEQRCEGNMCYLMIKRENLKYMVVSVKNYQASLAGALIAC